jgi:guanosine-3',5'-bis(diphosphate) 3'-pyrophosphohydrolase
MDSILDRSPWLARTALPWVENVLHRVNTLVRSRSRSDPVDYLIRTHRRLHPRADVREVRRAYEVAARMHEGQFRKSGDPYITHPLAVAQILAELGMDTTTLVAGLLHDTVEDTSYTLEELRADFGHAVALLVDGVTKFEKALYGDEAEIHTIRKMIVAADADVRVLIVKLADRLHNMRTLDARSPASRVRIARATQEVLIPLCERLGIQVLKRELEDCVLAATEPEAYRRLQAWVAHRPEWTAYTDAFRAKVEAAMRSAKIKARVEARPHHLYTIWRDSLASGAPEPYELPRIAILIDGPDNDCYAALGVLHSRWRPVAARFKDFIASPKYNLYRSLHTTVIGPDAQAIEVQIRTEEMDRDAVYGIVARFRFAGRRGSHRARRGGRAAAERSTTAARSASDQLTWLRNLVQWQEEAVDPRRFIESLRCDLTEDQIHVFVAGVSEGAGARRGDDAAPTEDSPDVEDRTDVAQYAGRHLVLPAGATPVDVAYALGPDIGDRCVAAAVNGQLVILSLPLSDGDVVEIHVQDPEQAEGPSPEWLTFVRTPQAQLHIEKALGVRDDPEKAPPLPLRNRALIGMNAIRMELHWRERRLADERLLHAVTAALGFSDPQALCVAVADRVVSAAQVADLLIEEAEGDAVLAATLSAATTAGAVAAGAGPADSSQPVAAPAFGPGQPTGVAALDTGATRASVAP